MKCPHCLHQIHPTTARTHLDTLVTPKYHTGAWRGDSVQAQIISHVCAGCGCVALDLQFNSGSAIVSTQRVFPQGGQMGPPPAEVPPAIAQDYTEANEVLPISPKASAALSRRCLQTMLIEAGYRSSNLAAQVDAALAEQDASKSLPSDLRDSMDAIRNFGNFSAHPITDKTSLQIIDVDVGEAEWCLQLVYDLFEHYYVRPARTAERKRLLNEKLAAAGKPSAKQAIG